MTLDYWNIYDSFSLTTPSNIVSNLQQKNIFHIFHFIWPLEYLIDGAVKILLILYNCDILFCNWFILISEVSLFAESERDRKKSLIYLFVKFQISSY